MLFRNKTSELDDFITVQKLKNYNHIKFSDFEDFQILKKYFEIFSRRKKFSEIFFLGPIFFSVGVENFFWHSFDAEMHDLLIHDVFRAIPVLLQWFWSRFLLFSSIFSNDFSTRPSRVRSQIPFWDLFLARKIT